MPTLLLVKFSKFEPVLLTVPYLSINYSQIGRQKKKMSKKGMDFIWLLF